jgi:predicted nucleic acid-binding protein
LDHPVYDCVYVAAAQHEQAKLLTVDKKLAQKLRTHKLSSLLVPT